MEAALDHESDFVGWTERQAALLRKLPAGAFGLDAENLAEEIADLGRSEIRETSSLLRQLMVHLIKLAMDPDAEPAGHWLDEVLAFQGGAVLACSPGIRQRIDLLVIWRLACNAATRSLARHGVVVLIKQLPSVCPFTIDDLLDPEFDPLVAVARLANAVGANRSANA